MAEWYTHKITLYPISVVHRQVVDYTSNELVTRLSVRCLALSSWHNAGMKPFVTRKQVAFLSAGHTQH